MASAIVVSKVALGAPVEDLLGGVGPVGLPVLGPVLPSSRIVGLRFQTGRLARLCPSSRVSS